MFAFFVVIHILICFALVVAVLLQSGRGGGLAGAFGGGAAQTFFGGRGAATFLSKTTAWLAVGFMSMSILLAVMSTHTGATSEGLLQQRARERAAQVALPPSSSALNPNAALDSLELKIPGESSAAGAPAESVPAGQNAGTASGAGDTTAPNH